VADALRTVPGFYDVYNMVSHNFGVRGINGGANSGGSLIKLMIDGNPVSYGPDNSNFFGEELIPIDLVERIEVIRGPASAVYGANAFLGVVNVITRAPKDAAALTLTGHGVLVRDRPGGGAEVVASGASDRFDVLVGASLFQLDRSGLALPTTSPIFSRTGGSPSLMGLSQGDTSTPRSLYAKGALHLPIGEIAVFGALQYLDASAQFQDFAPLTHSRIAKLNQTYTVSYSKAIGSAFSIRATGSYIAAAPTSEDRVDVGRADYDLIRRAGGQGLKAMLEGQYSSERLNITAGGDFAWDDFLLQTYDQHLLQDVLSPSGAVLRAAGTIIPGVNEGQHTGFRNFGAYAQGIVNWNADWSTTLGTRVDEHNVYGLNWSNRVGLVFAPTRRPLSVKLLYGSSFKPPTAEQLYTQPIGFLDLQGNPQLKAQTAHTFELAGGYRFGGGRGEITANFFVTGLFGRVEFLQRTLYLVAQNIDNEWVAGGELAAAFAVTHDLQFSGNVSIAHTVDRSSTSNVVADPRTVTNSLYPLAQVHLIGDYTIPVVGLHLGVEGSFISSRATSQANANQAAQPYEYPPYFYLAASLSTTRYLFGQRATRAALRVSNILNTGYTESGFGNVDVPALGRTFALTLSQEL
jgi:outer membrane receptor for ferrienterochelin and colicins